MEPSSESEGFQVVQFNENVPEPGEDSKLVLQSPKSSLNLSGLKAAFSMRNSPSNGTKVNTSKAASSSPTQKTLQSFFKGPEKSHTPRSTLHSPLKPNRDVVKFSPVGRSVLDGFRYGRTPDSDIDSGRDSTLSECDSTTATPDILCCGSEANSPDLVTEKPSIKSESTDELSDKALTVVEQTEPCTSSPEAKKARTEDQHFSIECESTTHPTCSERSSISKMDSSICIQKRTVTLQLSFQELAGRVRKLQEQQRQNTIEGLCYRRFRAKISPGENQSAEDELKKEIRWDSNKSPKDPYRLAYLYYLSYLLT